ncbi:hypothetical protein [Acidovorax sp. NCPPB 4044]|uniref:hypothetical protein n=1 Tax=Acidovorax sp. NCPPB 4044 TaxID=2940490 RepID=UPI0023030FD3|nr:hypothetical protein [Acidovorax sp. NCPPB 4044]MDA8521512.1 hypothetical protein [Acidovorax sp. NCPPB 4044]
MTSPSSSTAHSLPPATLADAAAAPAAFLQDGAVPPVRTEGAAEEPTVSGWCAVTRRWGRGDWTPEWFCAFLAGNQREQSRFRKELATMRGSVVWLLRQRRQGHWSADERERLRGVMRSASSVSPYLLVWAVPGSMLLLPFMAWFIDRRRIARERAAIAVPSTEAAVGLPALAVVAVPGPVSAAGAEALPAERATEPSGGRTVH